MKNYNYTSHICKDGDKYRVMYRYTSPDGLRRNSCKRGFTLRKEAKEWQDNELPQLIKELEHIETTDENMTMGELIEEYLQDSKINKRNSTYENKLNIFETKIIPYFKDKKVREITTNDIRKWHNKIKQQKMDNGKYYAPTYIHSIANQLSAVFNYAVAFHNLPKNPVRLAKQSMKFGKKEAPEKDFWTLEEYLKFSKAIQDKPIFYYAFQIFFWCGLRLSELLALTKEDINCDDMTLKVLNSFSKEEQQDGDTKTDSSKRIIHMPKGLAEEMREYMASLYNIEDTDCIFPLTKTSLHNEMTRGSKKAGVKRIKIHELRHSHITMLSNYISCASLTDISKRAGHKKPDITLIYTHRYSGKDELIAEELNEFMEGDITNVSEK